jgi:Mor transcription activator family
MVCAQRCRGASVTERHISAAELAVLEALLPTGLTPDMRDVAQCLFEPLVMSDERCGQVAPDPEWLTQLTAWAQQALMQLQHLATQKGGVAIYLAKGIAVHLSARDRKMCAEFRGEYKALGRKYGITEMRCRQIVDAWQRSEFLSRQGSLAGLD